MAKNKGTWTIEHGGTGENVNFSSRREAAAYAAEWLKKGACDLDVVTPDGRVGSLGSLDRATGTVRDSRWAD